MAIIALLDKRLHGIDAVQFNRSNELPNVAISPWRCQRPRLIHQVAKLALSDQATRILGPPWTLILSWTPAFVLKMIEPDLLPRRLILDW